jgi:hypothetical protein
MKKQLPVFLAGALTATMLLSLGTAALAMTGAAGTVEFNTVGLVRGQEQIFFRGEDYVLENGNLVPTSILFTDPSGNSTTYLPVRRIAELFQTELVWNGPDGNIEIPIINP